MTLIPEAQKVYFGGHWVFCAQLYTVWCFLVVPARTRVVWKVW